MTQRLETAMARGSQGILAIALGGFLGGMVVFLPPLAWVIIGAGGLLLLFPLRPGMFILGYLVISPILDQLVTLLSGTGFQVGPQIVFRGGLIIILVYYWLAIKRSPLLVKASLPMFILLPLLVASTVRSGVIDQAWLVNLSKLAFWMLLLPTVADMVAHKMIKLDTLYRCMVVSLTLMTASVLVASYFGVARISRYGVGEISGFFNPHALAISLSMGLIVTFSLAIKQHNRLLQLALWLFSALIILSITRTYVRTGWTTCITVLFILNLMFWRYGKNQYPGQKTLIWAQVLIAGMIVAYLLTNLESFIARNRDFSGGEHAVGSGRGGIYLYFLEAYANYPVLHKLIGNGFIATLMKTQYRAYTPHNDYLYILVAGGLVGFILFLWLFISLWTQIRATARVDYFPLIIGHSAIATYLVAAMTNGVWDYVAVMTYFSFLVGGTIGYYQKK